MRAKALELGMMPVTERLAAQHGTRQQPFAPKRHQALRI
jgi:hypothetical protein